MPVPPDPFARVTSHWVRVGSTDGAGVWYNGTLRPISARGAPHDYCKHAGWNYVAGVDLTSCLHCVVACCTAYCVVVVGAYY